MLKLTDFIDAKFEAKPERTLSNSLPSSKDGTFSLNDLPKLDAD
jgi:hypothetical protein